MLTEEQEVLVARIGAELVGRRYRRPAEEYLGAAWEGVRKLRTAVPDPGRGLAVRAAWAAAMNDARQDRRKWEEVGEVPETVDARPVPAHLRLAAAWAETRGDRAKMSFRVRIALYLICVEGWTGREVGTAFGVREATVSGMLSQEGVGGRGVNYKRNQPSSGTA